MYNKLFTKILDSSIWLESNPTRIVWITMIAAMDEEGFVSMASVANLARRANVSDEDAAKAIAVLESPDTIQPDQENAGIRIERVPGGWMVLNSEKYRTMVTRAESLNKNRERVARFRAKKRVGNGGVMGCNESVMQSDHKQIRSDHTQSSSPAATDAESVYALYPRKQGRKDALRAIATALKAKTVGELCEATAAFAEATGGWPADRLQFIPHPATWFNRGCYDDDRSTWIYVPKDTTVSWQRPATTAEDHRKPF